MSEQFIRTTPPEKDSKYWNKHVETMPIQELRKIQEKKMREMLVYVYENSAFYKRKFRRLGLKPDDIKTLEDFFKKVPFSDKDEVRIEAEKSKDPFAGTLCLPKEKIHILNPTTGTTGTPTIIASTYGDVTGYGSEQNARTLWMMGVRPGHLFHYCAPRWHNMVQFHEYALQKIGVTTIKTDIVPAEADRIISLAKLLKPDGAHLGIGLALTLEEKLKGEKLPYKYISVAGDVLVPSLRRKMSDVFGGEVYNYTGLADIHWYACECDFHNGIHTFEDLYISEVIDPETGEQVEDGERGELVLTNLWAKGQPHLRWRTGDIVTINREPCDCGRTHPRIYYLGRKAFAVKVFEKEIFPSEVEDAIREENETETAIFQFIRYASKMDTLKIRVAPIPERVKDKNELKNRLEKKISSLLKTPVEVEIVKPEEIEWATWKPIRILDLTKKT